ncbi:MAG: carbamoyltransferase C-terminal domain-containing protein [Candidatus Gracilibacteria bacterium]|nr:carbamoyltransferase C-terminal domain-containing protein [Candidatus Gracilibacteria bacterium]
MKKEIYISFVDTEHDPSIVMIYNNRIYGIELERLSRLKYLEIKEGSNALIMRRYFQEGLKYLLSIIGNYSNYKIIGFFLFSENKNYINDFNFDYNIEKDFYFLGKENIKSFFYENNLSEEHHFFHALSSYYPSNFHDSAILVMDNSGFFGEGCFGGTTFTQSVYHGNLNEIKYLISSEYSEEIGLYGIGTIYSTISELIGIEPGSIMGLSAYGNKDRFSHIDLFELKDNKVFFIKKGINFLELSDYIKKLYGLKNSDLSGFDDVTKTILADISAHLQYETEKAIEYLGKCAKKLTNSDNICVSGGVGLNVLANSILINKCGFKNIFVQSAVGDQGISLGGLYYLYYKIKGNNFLNKIDFSPYTGKIYTDFDVIFNKYKEYINILNFDLNLISNELKNNKIFGIFDLGSEFGPRALGHRSILASPLLKETNLKVNQIKSREYWRPLAPIILREEINAYLEDNYDSPYMTLSSHVKTDKLDLLKGVVHIDGTVRYQTITSTNGKIYDILNYFYNLSGIPVLINTSLNVKGEPIVETPEEAITLFLSTELDYLIIGDNILSKNKNDYNLKFNYDLNLFNISFNELGRGIYLKIWKYFEKIFFVSYGFKVDFCFIYKDKLSYNFYLGEDKYKINFFISNNENGYYFKHKNLVYNFSGNINNNLELKNILDKINMIIVNNYEKIYSLFLTLNNDK